jgi:hypothetical protein
VKKSKNRKNITLVEDRLDGSSNFNSWKSRLQVTLEEDDLLSVIQKTLPQTTTDEEKEIIRDEDVKARKILIYSVRDHLLPQISNLKTTYEMYEALKDVVESDNTLRALILKGKLQSTKMKKGDTVVTFFMKISEIKEQLGAIGKIMSDKELVLSTLNNLPKYWEPFFKASLEEKSYQPLIVCGQTVLKKNLDLEIEEWKTTMMKTMFLHFIQRKEEYSKETSEKHSNMRSLYQPQVIIREEMFQRFSALDVTNMGTM